MIITGLSTQKLGYLENAPLHLAHIRSVKRKGLSKFTDKKSNQHSVKIMSRMAGVSEDFEIASTMESQGDLVVDGVVPDGAKLEGNRVQ